MSEQFELEFEDVDASPQPEAAEEEMKRLSEAYQKMFGPDPLNRGFDKATILNALADPEKEHARLHEIDTESDQEELKHTYRR